LPLREPGVLSFAWLMSVLFLRVSLCCQNGIDDYVHRIGRTGRAGNTGRSEKKETEKKGAHLKSVYNIPCEKDGHAEAKRPERTKSSQPGGKKKEAREKEGRKNLRCPVFCLSDPSQIVEHLLLLLRPGLGEPLECLVGRGGVGADERELR